MPRNVEIKARLADLDAARATAERFGARLAGDLVQVDRYYELDGGRRVKLRIEDGEAELIRYDRPESNGVRSSEYERLPVRDPEAHACLVPTSPALVTVRKRRRLYLLDNVRIHLDVVAGLGEFLELEAVVDATHDEGRCREQIDRLLAAFGLTEGACIRASYGDLLRA